MLHDAKLPTTESSLIINTELRVWHFKLINAIMQKGAKIIHMAIGRSPLSYMSSY